MRVFWVAIAAYVMLCWSVGYVLAHDWYPLSCCSDQDCEQIANDAIEPRVGGYLIKATGEIWPYEKVKQPPPGVTGIHRCWYRAGPLKDHTICLFADPPGA